MLTIPELNIIKQMLIETGKEHLGGTTRGVYLDMVKELFDYIKELRVTNKQLRTKINKLRKEIK